MRTTLPLLTLFSLAAGCTDAPELDTGDAVANYPSLLGQVVDALDGSPVAGAVVCAEASGLGGCADADGSGLFTIEQLPPGSRAAFLVDVDGYAPALVPYLVAEGDDVVSVRIPVLPSSFVADLRGAAGGADADRGELVMRFVTGDAVDGNGVSGALAGVGEQDQAPLFLLQTGWEASATGTSPAGIAGFVGLTPGVAAVQTRSTPDCELAHYTWLGENSTSFTLRVDAGRVTFGVVGCDGR